MGFVKHNMDEILGDEHMEFFVLINVIKVNRLFLTIFSKHE